MRRGGETGGETGGEDTLSPREYVTYIGRGRYQVDFALVGQIQNDFSILSGQSTVLVESPASGYYQLLSVDSADLAYALGLRTGDILLSVNGNSLDGNANATAAYLAVENDSTITLTFNRAGTVLQHVYTIVYM